MISTAMATPAVLRDQLDEGLARMGIELDVMQRDALVRYVMLLDKWNKVYNLTAVRDPARMISLHILDSLSVRPHVQRCNTLLDVGSGGGLPGIPLAIACPAVRVTMLDTIAKKTTFVRQVIGELSLANADVVNERVEQYDKHARFAGVVSRAFAELKDFVEGAGHLCADGGRLFAMKGVYPHDEIARLPEGIRVDNVIPLTVPGVEGQRHLVVLAKTQFNH